MQQAQMRRFVITMIYCLSMSALVATAGTFPLTDGTKIVGSIDSVADKGVVFTLDSGETSSRIEWDKFTPEALKELSAEVKTDIDRARLKPLMESIPHEVAKAKEIVIKPLQRPDRPKHGSGIFAMFGSPLGWLIMLVLYGANLFAAYEVCIYRAPAPALPEPIIFPRGEFSFNRRFFETKFAGFFRVIPTEAEKDLVLVIKASRGEFVGRRISRITPNELYLQVVKDNASAEEMIPFAEIAEVQIRHKDSL
jgi:hypothetical protein